MAKETERFIDAGLTHYPSALLAVRRFEDTIREELGRALRHRAVDGSQVSYATGKGSMLYLQATQTIRLGSKSEAAVTIGLAWDDDPPYFYVYCDDGPPWAMHPDDARFTVDGGTSYFCEPDGASRDSVPKRLERLFADWLAAIGKARRVRKR